ncbi:MAG: hypothetical protein ACJ73S_08020 [Mycobacteriales bacterium]
MTRDESWDVTWEALPAAVRDEVDGLVLQDRRIQAVVALRRADLPVIPHLVTCQELVAARYRALGDRVVRQPPSPRDEASLAARVAAMPRPAVAIEASWDGDSQGWFVVLTAIAGEPADDTWLTILRDGGDLRLFSGQVPPWPEAREAAALGGALADRFGIPFHFGSPEEPDLDAPRWRDLAR